MHFLPFLLTFIFCFEYLNQVQILNNQSTLGFVTPWNAVGMQNAIDFQSSFNLISPVWFQIRQQDEKLIITGEADQDFLSKLESRVKIVPRFICEEFSNDMINDLVTNPKVQHGLVDLIAKKVIDLGFDGLVLETFTLPQYFTDFIKSLGTKMHAMDKVLVIVANPKSKTPSGYTPFTNSLYKELYEFIDFVVLMTYDYSSTGPLSPLNWVEKEISQLCKSNCNKVLMGIPFYGIENRNGDIEHILGKRFEELVDALDPVVEWNTDYAEIYFRYEKMTVWYPSVRFIKARKDLAMQLGCGIAIWELGQGLEEFFHIL